MGFKERISKALGFSVDPLIKEAATEFYRESPHTRDAYMFPKSAWLDATRVVYPDGRREVVSRHIKVEDGKIVEGLKFTHIIKD